jgi:hypothetical protein
MIYMHLRNRRKQGVESLAERLEEDLLYASGQHCTRARTVLNSYILSMENSIINTILVF